jgi:hypothetical protein
MSSLFSECVGKQTARVRAPREIGVFEGGELVGRCEQRGAPFRRVEVACELAHRGIVERRVTVQVAAGGEHEQRAADRRVALVVAERDPASGDVRRDDEVDVRRRARL